jgi:nickel superoxide dismutase
MKLTSTLKSWWPVHQAEAHCDIPCGIYDPIAAKIAAQTVQKMVMRIQALKPPDASASAADRTTYANTVARYITVKEQHAELCKKELDILWHDYFRPEHVQKYPDLHNTIWQANKLASKNKQSVDMDAAKQLVDAVDKVATIFWETKGEKYADPLAVKRFGT